MTSPSTIRLGIAYDHPADISSYFRGVLPFSLLARSGFPVQVTSAPDFDWPALSGLDVLLVQRPRNWAHLDLIQRAQSLRVPVWLDFDDAMDLIPPSNPHWMEAKATVSAGVLLNALPLANVITTGSAHHADLLSQRIPATLVEALPNAHNDYLHGFAGGPRKPVVVWRGGPSHAEDLESVLPSLARVARAHPDWQFHFLGSPGWQVRRDMPAANTRFHETWLEYPKYLQLLHSLRPSIQIVPWVESEFNACKTNLAWLEASAAGAVTLAPDWAEVFKRPGVQWYLGQTHFYCRLEQLMADVPAEAVAESRQYIRDHQCLSHTNRRRAEILTLLAGKSMQPLGIH